MTQVGTPAVIRLQTCKVNIWNHNLAKKYPLATQIETPFSQPELCTHRRRRAVTTLSLSRHQQVCPLPLPSPLDPPLPNQEGCTQSPPLRHLPSHLWTAFKFPPKRWHQTKNPQALPASFNPHSNQPCGSCPSLLCWRVLVLCLPLWGLSCSDPLVRNASHVDDSTSWPLSPATVAPWVWYSCIGRGTSHIIRHLVLYGDGRVLHGWVAPGCICQVPTAQLCKYSPCRAARARLFGLVSSELYWFGVSSILVVSVEPVFRSSWRVYSGIHPLCNCTIQTASILG